VTVGLGEYGKPSQVAQIALRQITDRGVHRAEHPEAY